jgi:hypothetical protein
VDGTATLKATGVLSWWQGSEAGRSLPKWRASLLVRANLSPAEEAAHCAARKPLYEHSGFENELVDVNGIEVFQITTLFHPLFKCFSRQELTMG